MLPHAALVSASYQRLRAAFALAPAPPPPRGLVRTSRGVVFAAVVRRHLLLTRGLLHSRLPLSSMCRLRVRVLPSRF
jgi:hypothetical protein